MGEPKNKVRHIVGAVKETLDGPTPSNEPMGVVTPGGRIQVRWDNRSNATAMGQLAFFLRNSWK